MTLRHYLIFITVCETMNMTAAAKRLFMSQPAVSQAIAEMERHYAVRLFERLSKKLYLTQSGETLEAYARHIIGLHERAEKEMRDLAGSSPIRVGASVTVCTYVLPELAKRALCLDPPILLQVIEGNTESITRLLEKDRLDIGIVEGKVSPADFIRLPFMEDELVLVCGKGHAFSSRVKIEIGELHGRNFIVREQGSGTRTTFEDVMSLHGIPWTASWVCNNTETILEAVDSGVGLAVIPKQATEAGHLAQKLHSIEIDGIRFIREFCVAYHKDKYLTVTMERFIELVRSFEKMP